MMLLPALASRLPTLPMAETILPGIPATKLTAELKPFEMPLRNDCQRSPRCWRTVR